MALKDHRENTAVAGPGHAALTPRGTAPCGTRSGRESALPELADRAAAGPARTRFTATRIWRLQKKSLVQHLGREPSAVPAVGQLLVRPGSSGPRKARQGAGLERGDGQRVGSEGTLGIRTP